MSFNAQAMTLCSNAPPRRAVALDLPDFGQSIAAPGFGHTQDEYAEFVGEALKTLGIRRAHLVLHDVGGAIGLIWASTHTGQVASVTLINTGILAGYKWHRKARGWQTPGVGELMQAVTFRSVFRRSIIKSEPHGLPRDFVDEMYDNYDRRTRRAVLDIYRDLADESIEPRPEHFASTPGQVLERFRSHVGERLQNSLRTLAFARSFDAGLLAYLKAQPGQPVPASGVAEQSLAARIAGVYIGHVISDSKGSSQSDVSVTVSVVDGRSVPGVVEPQVGGASRRGQRLAGGDAREHGRIEGAAQLDAQVGFDITRNFALSLQAQNLMPKKSATKEYSVNEVALNSYALSERRFSVGLRAKF